MEKQGKQYFTTVSISRIRSHWDKEDSKVKLDLSKFLEIGCQIKNEGQTKRLNVITMGKRLLLIPRDGTYEHTLEKDGSFFMDDAHIELKAMLALGIKKVKVIILTQISKV